MPKGVTPVVAMILLILLTVSIGGIFAVWSLNRGEKTMGTAGKGLEERTNQMTKSAVIDGINSNGQEIYLRNLGSSDITPDEVIIYVDDKLWPVNQLASDTIQPGRVGTIVFQNPIPSGKHEIKLGTSGFSDIITKTIKGVAWLSGFKYRTPITISSSNSLNDYQVLVTLDSSFSYSHTNSDGSDIRFTDEDKTSPLHYWIESWNYCGTSKIWVRVPTIPSGSKTIYIYYGNQTPVSSESNGDNTFLFFDDFDGTSLNSSKWTPYTAPSTYSVQNGYLQMWGNWGGCCDAHCIYNHINTLNTFDVPFVVESRFMVSGSVDLSSCCEVCYHTILNNRDVIGVSSSSDGFTFKIGSAYVTHSYNFPDKDNWHRVTETFTSSQLKIDTDYSNEYTYSGTVSSSGPIGLAGDTDLTNGYDRIDWILIRRYSSSEPITSVDVEESH